MNHTSFIFWLQNGNLVINGEFHVIRRRSVDIFSPHVLVQTEETYNFGTDYRDIPGKWNKTIFTVESCYLEHV
jgi:hypothetical protein